MFEAQPSDEKINLTLTVDSGHCIQFNKQHYRILDGYGMQTHYRKGTKVMVIQAYDGSLYCNENDKDIYVLDAIPEHEHKSRDFDHDYKKPSPQKRNIPDMNHPWRSKTFWKFVNRRNTTGMTSRYQACIKADIGNTYRHLNCLFLLYHLSNP